MTGSAPELAGADPAASEQGRRRPSLLRTAFYLISTALIIGAGFAVPLPYVETLPGSPTEIAPLVEIEGTEITELTGTSSLLTVRNREQPVIPAIGALLDPNRELRPVHEVFPPQIDRDEYHAAQRERFGRQFEVAAAVAAEAAGAEVELDTTVVVVTVVPDGPADGLLEPGDIVLEVDGEPLADAEALAATTHGGSHGQQLRLTIQRNDVEQEVVATLGTVPGVDGPRLGVEIADGVDVLRLPFDIRLDEGVRIGGPSAGLMVAITVYDLLSDEDLLRGRNVAGTGSLGAEGTVGTVGGIPQKLRAAAEDGAEIVFVPAPQFELARETAPEELRVVGVATFEEALEALREGT